MKRLLFPTLAWTVLLVATGRAQTELAVFQDPHPGATFGTDFGASVDIDGDTMVVGAWDATYQGKNHAGAAYVYRRVAGTWQFETELHPPSPEIHDQFGRSVAVSGGVVVVGAPDFPFSAFTGTGRAHVFRRLAGGWVHEATLVPSVAGMDQRGGWQVAVDGDRILVSTLGTLSIPPRIAVFERSAGVWSETAVLSAPVPNGFDFARDLELVGDTAVVGFHAENVAGVVEGFASVFRRSAGGAWTLDAKLAIPGPASEVGPTIAFDGQRVLLAAPYKDIDGVQNVGRVFVYVRQTGGAWVLEQTVENPDPLHHTLFGIRLAVSGDLAVALGQGDTATVLRREGGVWYAEPTLEIVGTQGSFAQSAALSLDTAVVGVPVASTPFVGEAHVLRLDPPFYLRLGKGKLIGGDDALYQVRGGPPGQFVWLAAGLTGQGTFPVPPLATSLDILNPFPIPPAPQTLDAAGTAQWKLPIPPHLVGLEVWMQAVRFSEATVNVRDDVIQP